MVAKQLEAAGWIVGSRRHIAGPGDLLAVNQTRRWLIECKATKGPWDHFGPTDRSVMAEYCEIRGLTAMLALALPEKQIRWIPKDRWPR